MRHAVVFGGRVLMARSADLIAIVLELSRVRVMAIGATDTFVVHLALYERAVDVVLVQHLTIRIISARSQKLIRIVIVELFTGVIAAGD